MKVCVITGSRAEYGLLRWLMEDIKNDPDFVLQVIATGMHLSPEFGLTYKEIERDGFEIDRKIEVLTSSDTPVGITKSMGLGLVGFAESLSQLKPNLLIVLGDRYEIFSAVAAALIARIPVAHIHGGEITKGVVDDAIRHSITKMAHLHFVASEEYRQRVIQLGEQPHHVFCVGGVGIDSINRLPLMTREEFEDSINFKLGKKNLLITFHPVTLEENTAKEQLSELLAALGSLKNTKLIFTLPNADTEGRALIQLINGFVSHNHNSCAHISLGQLRYFSCMAHVDGVVGNSSSGLLEAPSFKKGVINIGDRQRGRIQAKSIINCEPNRESIRAAITKLYSSNFQKSLQGVVNPYGSGGASSKILSIVKGISLEGLIKKQFHDISSSSK
jgi:GDP/UDP-N,N'-diacetylbacillosamine 2-epimerase (hydrolysing)